MGSGPAKVSENLHIPESEVPAAVSCSPAAYIHNGVVHMEAVARKMPNYERLCTGWLKDGQKPSDPTAIIRRYCSEKGGFCYSLNTGLAIDHQPTLRKHAMDIRHLKYAIGTLGFKPTTLKRGLDLEPKEVEAMTTLGVFYVPGFTSTSDGGGQFNKNTLLVIDARDASWALKIKKEWTAYPSESEVLLTCYTKFQFRGTDTTCHPQKIYLKVLKEDHM